MADEEFVACEYRVTGRVQGVGFRYFVQRRATALNLAGHVRNLSDGSVRVYAAGPAALLNKLEALLRQGPPQSQVRNVEVKPSTPVLAQSFDIR